MIQLAIDFSFQFLKIQNSRVNIQTSKMHGVALSLPHTRHASITAILPIVWALLAPETPPCRHLAPSSATNLPPSRRQLQRVKGGSEKTQPLKQKKPSNRRSLHPTPRTPSESWRVSNAELATFFAEASTRSSLVVLGRGN